VRQLVLLGALVLAMESARAQADCSVAVTGTLNFGVYAYFTPLDGATTLTVDCRRINQAPNRTVSYTIKLTSGPGSYLNRLMTHATQPGETLGYNLYRDAARALVWGDGTAGTVTVTGQFVHPPARQQTVPPITIYGRVPANQNVVAGAYQTTAPITVIVEY
jgi:spore coat protein U-like protein